jgi:hypothetical protein
MASDMIRPIVLDRFEQPEHQHVPRLWIQRNQRGALTQFDGGEPITVRAARYVGDILKYVPDDQAIAPRYSFHM